MNKLSHHIKNARLLIGFTQEHMAAYLGISSNNYNAMEKGRRPISKKTIEKLASMPNLPVNKEKMLYFKSLEKTPELAEKMKLIITQEDFEAARAKLAALNDGIEPTPSELALELDVSIEEIQDFYIDHTLKDMPRSPSINRSVDPQGKLIVEYDGDDKIEIYPSKEYSQIFEAIKKEYKFSTDQELFSFIIGEKIKEMEKTLEKKLGKGKLKKKKNMSTPE